MKTENINMWAMLAIFLILPFVMITSGILWKSQQLFLLMASTVFVAFSIKNMWIRLFLVYAFCWTIFLFLKAMMQPLTPVSVPPQTAMAVLLFLLAGAIIFKFVSESKLSNDKFYNVIRIAVLIQIIISVSQYFGFYPWDWVLGHIIITAQTTENVGPFIGTLGNRDILACFLAVSLPVFLGWQAKAYVGYKTKQVSIWLLTLAVVFVLLFSPSPGVIAAFVAVAVYYHRGWKVTSLALLGAVIYGVVYVVHAYMADIQAIPQQIGGLISSGTIDFNTSTQGRIAKWIYAVSQLNSWDTIIFGKGQGAFWGKVYPLHNEYVQTLFEFGLVGLFLLLGYIVTTFKYLWKSRSMILLASFAAVCIDMGANYSLHIATTAFLIIIIAGLIERQRLNIEPWRRNVYGKVSCREFISY
jgi:hypothetical protein